MMQDINLYLEKIKKNAYKDIYNLENNVLNKNLYTSTFIMDCLSDKQRENPSFFYIVKKIIIFYIKNIIRLILYILSMMLFKIKYKKNEIDWDKELIVIDIFFLVDKIINEKCFNENYFIGLYPILEKYKKKYIFLPRLYMNYKNPFTIIKLMDVLNEDKNNFLLEFELLSSFEILKIFKFILVYPFKIIGLLQNNDMKINTLFNNAIIDSLSNTSYIAYTRYLVGQKLSAKSNNRLQVFSWMEFQNMEKTFYKAINESKKNITVYGCQFSIYYKEYISMHITDVDNKLKITPNIVLLNGKYNYNLSKKQHFKSGVSLRYKNIFSYIGSQEEGKYILILLTYEINESIRILELLNSINDDVKIKIHPTTNKNQFINHAKKEWKFVESNIYDLFRDSKLIIVGSMSGTGLEAVACGLTVIIIASKNSVTSNPLLEYGKGKIWDMAFCQDDIERLCNVLMEYKRNNMEEIQKIALWYKENFFIEPTEENIVKTFELDKE